MVSLLFSEHACTVYCMYSDVFGPDGNMCCGFELSGSSSKVFQSQSRFLKYAYKVVTREKRGENE